MLKMEISANLGFQCRSELQTNLENTKVLETTVKQVVRNSEEFGESDRESSSSDPGSSNVIPETYTFLWIAVLGKYHQAVNRTVCL